MLDRNHWILRSSIEIPSRVMRPPVRVYHRSTKPTIVLFPEPLAPTSAVFLFAGIDREKSFRTVMSGRVGYEKCTSES